MKNEVDLGSEAEFKEYTASFIWLSKKYPNGD